MLSAVSLVVSGTTVVEGNDGVRSAVVVVSLSKPSGKTVTVNYNTAAGTAAAGSDYSAVSGKLTFGRGETSKTILVPVKGDRLVEPDENFFVNLRGANGVKIVRRRAVVTIMDDEPRISISDAAATEGNAGAKPFTFTVSLSAPYDQAVTVNYATMDGTATAGSDYAASAGAVTFAPGQTSQTITVLVNGDRLVEQNETFLVNLSNPSSYAEIIRGVGVGTIIDDEPGMSIDGAVNYGDQSPFIFTVRLSTASDEVVTVDFATADGTAVAGADYVATSGTLTFAPGDTTKTIAVAVVDPTLLPDKYFYVNLSGATNAPILYGGVATGYWYYDYGYYDGGGWYYDPIYGY
jgi:hypothetical protein